MHSMLGIAPARGKCYKKHSMHFAPQNKEENPLLLQEANAIKNIACILLRKTRRKILCSCKRQML